MSQFGKDAEDRLLNLVKEVQAHVSEGASPNDAIVKVARDNQVTNDLLPLIVQAHNVGTQSYQREKCSGKGTLCKVADFPIARIEEIREQLYPSQPVSSAVLKQANAVSADYSRPPTPVLSYETPRTKQASAALAPAEPLPTGYVGDPKTNVMKMASAKREVMQEIDQAKTAELRCRDQYLAHMGRVVGYFKQADYNRLPLAEVEYNAVQLWGPLAADVIKYAAINSRTKEARASGPPRLARAVIQTEAPYAWIKSAIAAAREYVDAKTLSSRLEKEAQGKIAAIERPFCDRHPDRPPPTETLTQSQPSSSGQSKAAFFAPVMAGIAGASAKGMSAGQNRIDKGLSDMELALDDPKHDDELRGIEAKAMLNDLLANDEVISGFDPGEVSEAYNEITSLSPSAATQPALMRPLLRKRLTAGAVEPFEAQQMADVEKTMRQTESMGQAGPQGTNAALTSPVLA